MALLEVIWLRDFVKKVIGVRGVDLKYPEFSESEANEFIRGDLRDVGFVRKCLEYKGTGGKFYEEVPYKYVHAFDEIYQFCC